MIQQFSSDISNLKKATGMLLTGTDVGQKGDESTASKQLRIGAASSWLDFPAKLRINRVRELDKISDILTGFWRSLMDRKHSSNLER
jgi:hypothetical protein